MFGNHGSCGLLEEGAHGKSPKCLGGNLGDFGEFWGILGNFGEFWGILGNFAKVSYSGLNLKPVGRCLVLIRHEVNLL